MLYTKPLVAGQLWPRAHVEGDHPHEGDYPEYIALWAVVAVALYLNHLFWANLSLGLTLLRAYCLCLMLVYSSSVSMFFARLPLAFRCHFVRGGFIYSLTVLHVLHLWLGHHEAMKSLLP